jgi:signal transduction histidine kinase
VGAIILERAAGGMPFSQVDMDFLEILASQASAALNNSLLFNRVRMQNRELKRMIMLKNSFFEHLSRDLRRPLEELKALLSRHSPEATAEAAETADRLTRSVDRIMSIPALQKEANEMYLHHIQVEEIVREIIAHLQAEIEARSLTVAIETPRPLPPFDGNREILNTILDEVICNAIVYNREGGTVRVLLEQCEQDLLIVVEDNGIGIKEEERDRVFDRFYRSLSSYESHKVGAGLGLYIVRNFVEAYGGSIRLEGRDGGGTLVRIRLPF